MAKKILIVEDEKDMQDLYKEMFQNQNRYEIEIESGSMPALRRLASANYDLIILDIIMEPIGGDSFFMYLKSDDNTAEIPVLVISVLGPEIMEKLNLIDHARYLQKPITRQRLLSTLDDIFTEGA